jgi:hypothetical protein
MVACLADVAGHRIAVDPHEPLGLADSASLGDVLKDSDGLLPGQVGMEQRCPLAFGESTAAGATSKETDRAVLAVMAADREVFPTPRTVIGTLRIQAAEAREVIHGPPPTTYPAMRASICDTRTRIG